MLAAQVDDLQPEAWLYTREDESVHVEVHEESGVWAASITGPGNENRLRVFHTRETFDTFRTEHNRELLSKGFRLRAISERRVHAPVAHTPATVVKHERRRR
ncbi:MAG: hypothetical protein ABL986_05755 [Vicinamibacterales bacterium]